MAKTLSFTDERVKAWGPIMFSEISRKIGFVRRVLESEILPHYRLRRGYEVDDLLQEVLLWAWKKQNRRGYVIPCRGNGEPVRQALIARAAKWLALKRLGAKRAAWPKPDREVPETEQSLADPAAHLELVDEAQALAERLQDDRRTGLARLVVPLVRSGGCLTSAARRLGVSRRTAQRSLYRLRNAVPEYLPAHTQRLAEKCRVVRHRRTAYSYYEYEQNVYEQMRP
jgi:DNA-directed RNA polymerase specialized sigma24 family protein